MKSYLKVSKSRKQFMVSLIPEALKGFCFVSVSVILPKQNPVSVKLPFPYWVFRLGYLFHIDCFGSVTLLMFQLPGFCFVSVSFVSYKCTLGRNLKMAGICLAILPLPLSLSDHLLGIWVFRLDFLPRPVRKESQAEKK